MDTNLLPPVFPTIWASEWGEDKFGLYVALDFQGVIQRFRWIAPGIFLMGSREIELERGYDETQHAVTLTQGFWLADSACIQVLWEAVMGSSSSVLFSSEPERPNEQIGWEDVQAFLRRINAVLPDLQARLPTEAEWGYARRAGVEQGQAVSVKPLLPNPWGLLYGSKVWEWCVGEDIDSDPCMLRGDIAGCDRSIYRGWIRAGQPFRRSSFRLALGPDRGSNL